MKMRKKPPKSKSLIQAFGLILFLCTNNSHSLNRKTVSNPKTKNTASLKNNQQSWLQVRENSENAVVQLFVQVSAFNWLEPYKTPRQYEAYGTGFFIDNQGHIVSNYHVIEEASGIQLQLPAFGKRRFDVEIVGVNPQRDVALLKLAKKSFDVITNKLKKIPFLRLGDSDKIRSTNDVLVLGYPFGHDKLKTTKGIISARQFLSDDPFFHGDSYLQIDAALNPGNSGGPSFNKAGEIIGINTSFYAEAQNIGYIIPINDVKNIINELHSMKLQRKSLLGAKFGNDSETNIAQFLNNPPESGWYISRVFKDTILENSGIKEGDMLYKINGYKVDTHGELDVPWSESKVTIFDIINRMAIGETVKLTIYRNGNPLEITFKLETPTPLPIRFVYPELEKVDYELIGGMVVMSLTLNHVEILSKYNPHLVKYYKRENQYKPYLILTHIIPNSQTQKARSLEVGQILEEVNGKKVKTPKDFRLAIENNQGKFLSVKTKDKSFMVLDIERIVKEEEALAKEYVYEKSKLIESLKEKTKNMRK